MTLGKRIKAARERLDMSQEELGDACGVSKQAVYQWEKDETAPEADRIPALRKALRVTFLWIMIGDGPPPELGDPAVLFEDGKMQQFESRPQPPAPPRRRNKPKRRKVG